LATFKTQVEALTGISIDGSSNPTQTELSSFLVDGVKDVIHRMIEVRPAELPRFCSTTDSGAGAFVAKVGNILSVVREHDSPSILRKCIQIDPGDRYDATDSESLNYRSKTNPGFYELNGKIHTVPVAAESGDNNVVVTQLFYDTGVAYGDEVPDNFPESYAYLVAIYAAIKSLQRKIGGTIISIIAVPPDVPSLVSYPDAPTLTTVTFTSTDSAVDATLVAAATSTTLGGSSTAPAYDNTIANTAIGLVTSTIIEANNFIDGDEDVELAAAKLSEVQATINDANLRIQNELNEFNQANIAFQAGIQEAMAEFQSGNQIAISNAERSQNRQLQNSINDMQAIVANNDDLIANYSTEVGSVNQENASKISKYSAEVAEYQAEVAAQVQEQTTQTTQYQLLHAQLRLEYDAAFVVPGGEE